MKYDMVAFDLDGVIVAGRSSWEWVHAAFGVDNSDNLEAFCNGELDDHEFMRSDIALWKSVDPDASIDKVRSILMGAELVHGAVEAVKSIKASGARVCIVSGGIDLLADHIGQMCGTDRVMSNGLVADERGKLLGDGILRVELRDKAKALSSVLAEFGIPPERCAAIGNSWVDVSMFKLAAKGIAFNPIDAETIRWADVVVESNDLRDVLEHLD
jgi:phosphoserine phosphatase